MYAALAVLVNTFVLMQPVGAEPLGWSDLLDRYEATQQRIMRFADEAVKTSELRTREGVKHYREESVFLSDGNRVHWRTRQWNNVVSAEQPAANEGFDTRVFLWDGTRSYEYRDLYQRPSQGPRQKVPARLFVGSDADQKAGMIAVGYVGAPLMGIFESDLLPVSSILRGAKKISVRPKPEEIGGVACYVVEAATDHGSYTVWFDTAHGYNIARAEVSKKTGDLALGKPLGWVAGDVPPANSIGIIKPIKTVSFILDQARFQEIDGVWVPMEARYNRATDEGDGVSVVATHVVRERFEVNPDFEGRGAFRPDFPDGAQVFMFDAPGISFGWQGGRPVPAIDRDTIRDLDKAVELLTREDNAPGYQGHAARNTAETTAPGTSHGRSTSALQWPSVTILGFGLIIAALVVGLLLYRRKRISRQGDDHV